MRPDTREWTEMISQQSENYITMNIFQFFYKTIKNQNGKKTSLKQDLRPIIFYKYYRPSFSNWLIGYNDMSAGMELCYGKRVYYIILLYLYL